MTDLNYGAKDFLLARYRARRASIPRLSDFNVAVIVVNSIPVPPRVRAPKEEERREVER